MLSTIYIVYVLFRPADKSCKRKAQKTIHVIYEKDNTPNITSKIDQTRKLDKRFYHCDCGEVMNTTNEMSTYPMIAIITIAQDPDRDYQCELENVMYIEKVVYDLLSVIYHIGGHFICTFRISEVFYEYDGVGPNLGVLQKLISDSPHTITAYWYGNSGEMAAHAAFYVKNKIGHNIISMSIRI